MQVAFLGIGIMGSRMAANLVKAGHEVTAWNRTPDKAQDWAREHGGAVADTPQQAAAAADFVISMVVDGPMAADLLEQAAEGARHGATFIDMSTIGPDYARAIASSLQQRGVAFLDAPVTGSAPRAADGTLTIMAGGPEAVFETARPLFEAMGEVVLHAGEQGQGQVLKLVNNALAAANAFATAQAFVLADAAGADLEKLSRVLDAGSGGSVMASLKAPPMIAHDYSPLFKTEHMLKDVRLCLDEAQKAGAPFSAAALARDALSAAVAQGHGQADFASMIESVEGAAGHRLGG